MLFQEDERLFLSVLCGTVAQYNIDFELLPHEAIVVSTRPTEAALILARKVFASPEPFSARQIQGFEHIAGVADATNAWRQSHAAP
jgi:hypothetical protein